MSRLDPNSDLATKQILVNIQNDQDFMNACSTSKTMLALCQHEDLWEDRLRRYYPQFVELKSRTHMKWIDIYAFAVSLRVIKENPLNLEKKMDLGSFVSQQKMEDIPELLPYNDRINEMSKYLSINLLKQDRIEELAIFYDGNNRDRLTLNEFIQQYSFIYLPISSLFEKYSKEFLEQEYILHSTYITKERRQEFLKEFNRKYRNVDKLVLNDLSHNLPNGIREYPVLEETAVTFLLKDVILRNMGGYPAVVSYMISQDMFVDAQYLLPTTLNMEFYKQNKYRVRDGDMINALLMMFDVLKMFIAAGLEVQEDILDIIRNGEFYSRYQRMAPGLIYDIEKYLKEIL